MPPKPSFNPDDHRFVLLGRLRRALMHYESKSGLPRGDFSAKLGLQPASYSRLMYYEINPSIRQIERLAERLGIDPVELLSDRAA
jgi:hypothetical protein